MQLSKKSVFHAKAIFGHEFEIMDSHTYKNRYVFKLLPLDRAYKVDPSHVYVTFLRSKPQPKSSQRVNPKDGQQVACPVTTCIVAYKDRSYKIDVRPYTIVNPHTNKSELVNYYDARRIFESYHWDMFEKESPNVLDEIPFLYPKPNEEWSTNTLN